MTPTIEPPRSQEVIVERMTLTTLPIHQVQAHDSYPAAVNLPDFDPHNISRHKADAHWVTLDGETVTARCSLWWRNTPSDTGDEAAHVSQQVGLIGHFAAANDETATTLLNHACSELALQGCTLAVGPIDGNTWRNYRLATETNFEPPFFLEPQNRAASPEQFRNCGFSDFAHYFSAVTTDLPFETERVKRLRNEFSQRGIVLRPLSNANFDSDLRQIHTVARAAFRSNLLYQDIAEAEFLDQYKTLRNKVPYDLILLAEEQGRVVGFVFCVPDLLQKQRGAPVDTVVIKTLGVTPGRQFAGLGQLLLEEVQHRAAALGFTRAIHAMVREAGNLQRISSRYAKPFRRYALFAKELCE